MQAILSIDVESWIHFYHDALRLPDTLSSEERKVLDGGYIRTAILKLLDILAAANQRATFFIVAEVYEWYPDAVEAIASHGHEIGYHTHQHTILTSVETLRQELIKSKLFLDRFNPRGFRAPQITMPKGAFACLKEFGFTYSSSTYDYRGGIQQIDGVDEIPVSALLWRHIPESVQPGFYTFPRKLTWQRLAYMWPIGSGLSFILGGRIMKYGLSRWEQTQKTPAMVFVHPWQLFDHPQIRGGTFLWRVAVRNSFCIPYVKNVFRVFHYLIRHVQFVTCNEIYYG